MPRIVLLYARHLSSLQIAVATVLVTIGATALRMGVAPRQALWADELFSLAMATGHSLEHPARYADPDRGDYVESLHPEPPAHYARYVEHDDPPDGPARVVRAVFLSDTNPPLYYLLLLGWTRAFGTGDVALRLFSVLASLACIPLLLSLARRIGGPGAALPAVILFSASPLSVYYSTEGRMYALVWLWTAALLWLTLKLRTHGGGAGLWAAWVSAGAAGLLTHYFFAPVWAAVCVWLLVYPGRSRRRAVITAALLTAAAVLPWYAFLPESLSLWRVTGHWLRMPPGGSRVSAALRLPWRFLSVRTMAHVGDGWAWSNAAAFAALFALAGLRLRARLFTPRRLLLWLCSVAAVAAPIGIDIALNTYSVMNPRYALAGLPAAMVLVGVMLGSLRPALRSLLVALVVLFALVGVRSLSRIGARNGEPFERIGTLLVRETRAGDIIVVHSIPSGVCGVARYMIAAGATGDSPPLASWVARLRPRELPADLESLAAGRRRIVLVKVHTVGEPAPQEDWLGRNARLVSAHRLQAAEVVFFEPAEGETFFPGSLTGATASTEPSAGNRR